MNAKSRLACHASVFVLACTALPVHARPSPLESTNVIQAPPAPLSAAGHALLDDAERYHAEEIRAARAPATGTWPQTVREYADKLVYDNRQALEKLGLLEAMQGGDPRTQDPSVRERDAHEGSRRAGSGERQGDESPESPETALAFLRHRASHQRAGLTMLDSDWEQVGSPNLEAYRSLTRPMLAEHLKIAERLIEEIETGGDSARMSLVERGEYLARAGDCVSCHTRPGGAALEGGLPIETPYGGVIYSANITPSAEGIGEFSDADFIRAMHEGLDPDGRPYYPAFPYPSFTLVSDEDLLAIKAYLFSLPGSHYRPPDNDLPWPLGMREILFAWQELFFTPGYFKPRPSKSDVWNRGAYLVEGLGHCQACHTPRNLAGAKIQERAFAGAEREGWVAPNLTSELRDGVGAWSEDQLVTALRTGMTEPQRDGEGPRAALLGPMAEVVHRSLSYLLENDLRAIALYLKDLPPVPSDHEPMRMAGAIDAEKRKLGDEIYQGRCAACHGETGGGRAPYVPALRQNPTLQASRPDDVVMSILAGGPVESEQAYSPYTRMPPFADMLSDREVAAVASYLRERWGRSDALAVPDGLVSMLRHDARISSRD